MYKIIGFFMGVLAPISALAQFSAPPADASSILLRGSALINLLIKVLVGVAILMIIIGVIQFIIAAANGSGDARKKATDTILYGVLGLFVITTIWGLVGIVKRTLGTGGQESVNLPCVPGQLQNC